MAKKTLPDKKKNTRKPGGKRTKEQIILDRQLIWELYNQKVSQEKIAKAINERANGKYKITRQTIALDIAATRNELIESLPDKEKHIASQIGRIDRLEAAAWDAWERSKNDIATHTKIRKEGKTPLRVTNTNSKKKSATTVEIVDIDYTEERKRLEQSVGDPKFMEQIRWCITERSKLLALYSTIIKPKEGGGGEIQSSGTGTVVYLPDNGRNDFAGDIKKLK